MEEDSNTGVSPRNAQTEPYKEPVATKVAFLAGLTFFSLFAGLGLNLGLAGRRYRRSLRNKPGEEGHEDPVLLASRALAWGTAYSVGGTGLLVLVSTGVWKFLNR
jgi:hypothetical protein